MGNMGSLLPDVQHALELARQGIPKVQVYPELRKPPIKDDLII